MKIGIVDSGSQKAYLYDNSTGKIIPWDDITEITEDMIELSEGEYQEVAKIMNETISFSIECALPLDKLADELEPEPKTKPNPVYVPKHIARRRKW